MTAIEAIKAGPCPDCGLYHPKDGSCKAQRKPLTVGAMLTDADGKAWFVAEIRPDGSVVFSN